MNKSSHFLILFYILLHLFFLTGVSLSMNHPVIQKIQLLEEGPSGVRLHFNLGNDKYGRIDLPDGESTYLPGYTYYIAVPTGAEIQMEIHSDRNIIVENLTDFTLSTTRAFENPRDIKPQERRKKYSEDVFYPKIPVHISPLIEMRGVEVVVLRISPFRFNPVKRTMKIHQGLEIELVFKNGTGQFGDTRLRNRWWDAILKSLLLNYKSLPKIKYPSFTNSTDQDFEYLIITPDNPDFISWADSLRIFRSIQGIRTGVVTLSEIGGNSVTDIENYINNAYNSWTIPPVGVLLLGDYGTGSTLSLIHI